MGPPPPYLLPSQLFILELILCHHACPNQQIDIESSQCFSTALGPLCLCKTRTNYQEIFPWAHLEKSQLEVTMKVVVFFGVFGAIGAMVLLISL